MNQPPTCLPTLPFLHVLLPLTQLAPVLLTSVRQGLQLLVQVTLRSFLRVEVVVIVLCGSERPLKKTNRKRWI